MRLRISSRTLSNCSMTNSWPDLPGMVNSCSPSPLKVLINLPARRIVTLSLAGLFKITLSSGSRSIPIMPGRRVPARKTVTLARAEAHSIVPTAPMLTAWPEGPTASAAPSPVPTRAIVTNSTEVRRLAILAIVEYPNIRRAIFSVTSYPNSLPWPSAVNLVSSQHCRPRDVGEQHRHVRRARSDPALP